MMLWLDANSDDEKGVSFDTPFFNSAFTKLEERIKIEL